MAFPLAHADQRMAGAEIDLSMKTKMPTSSIPTLAQSPFAPLELIHRENLSAGDREFLGAKEKIIEAGQKTFLEAGTALMEIRDYKNGLLFKRYGSFAEYCRDRWEFGPAYGYRLITAVEVYNKLSPRGDSREKIVMPTTEKQLRALSRLPTPKLQKTAWKAAAEAAGSKPIRTRDVEKEVSALIERDRVEPPAPPKKGSAKPVFYGISAGDVAKIVTILKRLRKAVAMAKDHAKITPLIDEIQVPLPTAGGKR